MIIFFQGKRMVFLNLAFIVFLIIKSSCGSPATIVGFALTALDKTVERANQFYSSLENDNDITPQDIILSYVETIPVIGDIMGLITGNLDDIDEVILENIQSQLDALSNLQKTALHFLQNLHNKINLVVLKNQIASSSKVINSCYMDLTHFLQNSKSEPEKDRFLQCYDSIMAEVRHLGRILKEEEFTLESPKLFTYIISQDGFCNGTKIVNTYKYLFGLFFLGCETAVLSEAVKYGNISKTLFNECITHINEIEMHMREIYDICIGDSCNQVINVLSSVIQTYKDKDINKTAGEISTRLPWFSFTLFKFMKNPKEEITGNFLPSIVTIHHGYTHFIIVWTPYQTLINPDDSSLSFILEFETAYFESDYRGMNITRSLASKRGVVIGYFSHVANNGSYDRCSMTSRVNLASETTANRCNDMKLEWPFLLFLLFVRAICEFETIS